MYYMLFYCFYLILELPCSIEGRSVTVILDELDVGQQQNYTINDTVIYLIEINNISDVIERVPPRIYLKCEDCNENQPLLVVVTQNKGILSWELPLVVESNNYHTAYKKTERTLCPYDIISMTNRNVADVNKTHPVTLSMSTSTYLNKTVQVLVNLEENFVMELNKNKTVQVSPSTPAFYLFEFSSQNVSSVLLEVTSEDDICLIVSLQNVSCPVFDLEENIPYRGNFQTVTRRGGLVVTKETFPHGFYIVLVVSGKDKYCSTTLLQTSQDRNKNVVLNISKNISVKEYYIAISITIFLIILFCVLMFTVFYILIQKEKKEVPNIERDSAACTSSDILPFIKSSTNAEASITENIDGSSIKTDSSLDETDLDMAKDAKFDKDTFRLKTVLYVSDLARKNPTVLQKKSMLYFRSLITVAIFYFLPVLQLVFSDQFHLKQSGKEDLCYYNFLCAHPLWWFSDFNHVFSNIGYIVFGFLFILFTVMKERVYNLKMCGNKRLDRHYGIPQHFGLFYAMGAALIIEGIMSSCYHICPNHYNFQFDTSFMYVICTLCMIKIYQTRHPDISASAYATFSLLALVIFLGMYGVFKSDLTFWILFTILHLSICIHLSLQIYYMGRLKFGVDNFVQVFRSCRFSYPNFPSRFALLLVANICNWGLAAGSFIFRINNFSSYLLSVFMVNLLLYAAFYIIMKFCCKERLPLQSVIYILMAMLCWGAALYFFFSKTVSWNLIPAESKLYNQKCILLDFYDNHDIWHFLSAAAMFFSFMVLLTLDDDLAYVLRSNIVVF